MDDRLAALPPATDERFDRICGLSALGAAGLSVIYAISFAVQKTPLLSAMALMAGGLLSAVALFAVYQRVKPVGALASLGLVFGLTGVLGAAIHGAYDLSIVLHPEAAGAGGPYPVDPRGFLTFGLAGLGVLVLSWSGFIAERLPRALIYLGFVFGVLLILIYLGRLIILDPNYILVLAPAALTGLIVGPLWYGWVGWLLLPRRPVTG
jgi:hypothetical protein